MSVKPRLVDVAAIAGVSMKTVSNVVNGAPNVRDATKQRVEAAIQQLGYQPNLAARNLAQGRSGVIALAIPHLDRPYFASLAARVLDEAERVGWTVQIRQTDGTRESELAAIHGPHATRLDGLVISPVALSADDLRSAPTTLPMVLLGEEVPPDTPWAHVSVDNQEASRCASEHLIAQGCRRIIALGPGNDINTLRMQGYRDAVVAAGLSPSVIATGGIRGQDAEESLGRWLDASNRLPDGIFAGTDWLAMGAIRALIKRGFRVPDDVLVMGFDDIPYDLSTTPSLSTIAPDRAELARLVVAALRKHQSEPRHIRVPFELVVRESTLRESH